MKALNSATPESLRVPCPTTNIGRPVMTASPYSLSVFALFGVRNLCSHYLCTCKSSVRPLISAGGDHPSADDPRLAGSDHEQAVHVDHCGFEVGEGGQDRALVGTAGVANHSDRGGWRPVFGQQLQGATPLPVPFGATRVVAEQHEVTPCGCGDSSLDHRPRGVQIGQAEVAVVMSERGTQHCGSGQPGRYTRHTEQIER